MIIMMNVYDDFRKVPYFFFLVVFSARKSSKIRKNVKMFVCTIMLIKDIVIDAGLLA